MALLGKCAGPLMKVAVPLARNVLALLVTMELASAIDVALQKICTEEVLQEQEKESV